MSVKRFHRPGRPADFRDPASAQGEGRRYKALKREFFLRPVIINPVTCADARFARAAGTPRETDAWAEVLELCRDASRVVAPSVSWEEQACRSRREDPGLLARPEAVDRQSSIENVAYRRINLPSD